MNKIALYSRLSVEDKIKTYESESITHQRMLLQDYVRKHKDEFKGHETAEYIDDGYSGSSINRPSFLRLLDDIKSGDVSIIIVKDFSRFMRDYIVMGDYLENIFPFLGVRFIAINDGYDSDKEQGNGTDLDIQFKSLLYDFYAKEISEKTKTVCDELKKQGKMMGPVPYGYMKDPDDKHSMVIDEKAAKVVQRIFALAFEGKRVTEIARILDDEKATIPVVRKQELLGKKPDGKKRTWSSGTIVSILNNENYTGTYTYGMNKVVVVGSKKYAPVPKEQWGRVYDNHEAIISREDFEKIQKIRVKTKRTYIKRNKNFPLQGVVRCKYCDSCISIKITSRCNKHNVLTEHIYFFCRKCKESGDDIKYYPLIGLEEKVLDAITQKYSVNSAVNKQRDTKKVAKQIDALEHKKMKAFEEYKLSNMTREQFIELKTEIDSEIERITSILSKEQVNLENITETKLTKDLVEKYIESVYCKKGRLVSIQWKNDR